MGNSGSIPNITSKQRFTFEELDSYYKQQQLPTPNRTHQYQPIQLTDAYLHETYPSQQQRQTPPPVQQPHIKVLPDFNPEGARLRATYNGNILNSGGTISGRKEHNGSNLTPVNSPKQSNKISGPNRQQRLSNTNYEQKNRLNQMRRPQYHDRNNSPSQQNSSRDFDNYGGDGSDNLTSAKAMLKNKKKKFAPQPPAEYQRYENNSRGQQKLHVESIMPPPKSMIHQDYKISREIDGNQRKLRLFKTKAESKKFPLNQTKGEDPTSRNLSSELGPNFNRSTINYLNSSKNNRQNNNQQDPRSKELQMPMFRREKSFDVSLLSNHRKQFNLGEENLAIQRELGYKLRKNTNEMEQKISSNESESSGQMPSVQLRRKSIDYERPSAFRKSVVETKINLKKVSQPQQTFKTNFKKELEEATKRRRNSSSAVELLAKKEAEKPQSQLRPKSVEPSKFRLEESSQFNSRSKTKESLNSPLDDESKINRLNNSGSKIPQLASKTFYFGDRLDKNRSISPSPIRSDHDSDKIIESVPALDSNKLKTLSHYKKSINDTDSDASSDIGATYRIDPNSLPIDCDDEDNPNGIQLNVRPILPRRQLEIPRFSPSAAWRMLNEEQKDLLASRTSNLINNNETRPLEERIQRIFREPNPLYHDNKSGDSGISGDAGLLEGAVISTGVNCDTTQNKKVPWTPQQDLDDEETSSEDEARKGYLNIVDDYEDEINEDSGRGHVFSLSLPRENHLPTAYTDKEKVAFSSLQKLKRTVSGAFSGGSGGANSNSPPNEYNNQNGTNYRSDNWLLSRSQPNSIENSQISSNGNRPNQGQVYHASLMMTTSLDENSESVTRIEPASLNYVTQGRHMMYLPKRPKDKNNNGETKRLESNNKSSPIDKKSENKNKKNQNLKRENLQDVAMKNISNKDSGNKKSSKNHRFTFQSTVRQIERRRIAEKLSKEADEKEAQRKSELEAMSRVEEEFQRKRAREKATICHQLRLFSMEDNQCTSLPVELPEYDLKNVNNKKKFTNNNINYHRAEPDGQSPRSSPSFGLKDGHTERNNYYYEPELEEQHVKNLNRKGYLETGRKRNSMNDKKENYIVPIIRERQRHRIQNINISDSD